jgi:hypothetical protein
MVAIRIPGPESIDKVPVGDRERTIVPHATGASYGGQLAEAQGQLANVTGRGVQQAFGDIGNTLVRFGTQLRERRQQFEDTTYSSTYQTEYEPRARKEYQDAQKQFPDGGEGFTQNLNDRLQKAQKETHDAIQGRGIAPSEKALVSTDAHAANVRTHYLVNGMTWENNQKVKSLEDQLDQNAASAAAATLSTGDVDAGLDSVDQAIAAQHGVVPSDRLRLKHQAYTKQVYDAAITNANEQQDYTKATALQEQFYGRVPKALPPGTEREGAQPAGMVSPRNPQGLQPWQVRTFEIESGTAYRTGQAAARTGNNYGLGQFSPDLERKYGLTPADRDNPVKQAEALTRERADFEKALGRKMEDWEFYLAHQQGMAGSKALLENPNAPAWEVIRPYYSDAEARRRGFANGDAYAKAAISGNIFRGSMLKGIPVENVSASQFADMWRAKWSGAPESPDIGKAIRWADRIESSSSTDRTRMKNTVNADIASISSVGKPNPNLSYDQVFKSLGRDAADAWQMGREDAQKYHDATQDFHTLPPGEMTARVESLKPTEATPEFIRQQKMYLDAQKQADEIMKQRFTDPAASVNRDPEVMKARTAMKWDDPASVDATVTARLAAQERAGIDPHARSPITNREGLELMAPLLHMPPGTERARTEEVIKRLQATFGDAVDDGVPRVINAAYRGLDAIKADQEFTKSFAAMMRKAGLGIRPTRADARTADQDSEIAAAEKAVTAPLYADPKYVEQLENYFQDPNRRTTHMGLGPRIITGAGGIIPPQNANIDLRRNPTPEKMAEYDRKYGRKGMAEDVLREYGALHQLPPVGDVPADIPDVPTATPTPQASTVPPSERTTPRPPNPASNRPVVRSGGQTYRVQRDESGRLSGLNAIEQGVP